MKQFSNLLFVFVTALVPMKAVGNEINTIPADIMTTIRSQVEMALSFIPKTKHAEFVAKVDDHLKKYSHIQIAAQRGDVKSQFELGRMFESGYMDYDSAFIGIKEPQALDTTERCFTLAGFMSGTKLNLVTIIKEPYIGIFCLPTKEISSRNCMLLGYILTVRW